MNEVELGTGSTSERMEVKRIKESEGKGDSTAEAMNDTEKNEWDGEKREAYLRCISTRVI